MKSPVYYEITSFITSSQDPATDPMLNQVELSPHSVVHFNIILI
jgi:hypothetical protein